MTLEDRYGSKKRNRLNLIVGIIGATVMVLIGVAFLVFDGMPSASKAIEFRDIAMDIESDEQVHITYEVTTAANKDMACVLDALSPSYFSVGSKIVEIPASTDRTRVFEGSVTTIYRATTVTVKHCWFPEL